ncbi:MAG: hypothetical protein ACRDZ2_14585 [Ilumatobacteraceae bacterium]
MRRLSLAALLLAAVLIACAREEPDAVPGPTVAVVEVLDETYRIELATPELVAQARDLLAGEELPSIPIGRIVRDEAGPNAPWSWHVDAATIEFTELTTAVCDGLPSAVEDGSLTSDFYCPWSAEIVAVEQTQLDAESPP